MKLAGIKVLLGLLLLGGCAPWKPISKIDLGMTKAQVLAVVGKPESASGSENREYFWYIPVNKFWERYYVCFVDGRVTSYGRRESEK